MVRDRTLAQLSDRYKLPDQLLGHKAALAATRRQEKTRSSLFEAYIAALYLSHVEQFERPCSTSRPPSDEHIGSQPHGEEEAEETDSSFTSKTNNSARPPSVAMPTEGAVQGRDDDMGSSNAPNSPSMPARPDSSNGQVITADESESIDSKHVHISPAPTPTPYMSGRGYALAKVDEWLRPLFTPIAHWALNGMREEQIRLEECPPPRPAPIKIPAEWAAEDEHAAGMAGALNVYVQNTSGNMPAYHYDELDERDPANPHTAMWRATCVTRGKNGIV